MNALFFVYYIHKHADSVYILLKGLSRYDSNTHNLN